MHDCDEEIRAKVYDIELAVKDIHEFPQTYSTILKHLRKDSTMQRILRRKLESLCKEGKICKSVIPNTRFGQSIYFMPGKKYLIIFESGGMMGNIKTRIGCTTYCLMEYKKERFNFIADRYWRLDNEMWTEMKEPYTFFMGKILKVI